MVEPFRVASEVVVMLLGVDTATAMDVSDTAKDDDIAIVVVGIFIDIAVAVGEPFKLLAFELSFTERFEKDESSEWQGDVGVLGTSTLILAFPGYS